MNGRIRRNLHVLVPATIGFVSILIPKPYAYVGIAFLLIGLIALFVIGWKVSLRSLFEMLRNRRITSNPELTEGEKKAFSFAVALAASVVVAMLIRSLFLSLLGIS
jgi:hypothetical protein